MEYFSACSEAYGHDPNFKALMTALTASEDFFAFQQLMFLVTRALSQTFDGPYVKRRHWQLVALN